MKEDLKDLQEQLEITLSALATVKQMISILTSVLTEVIKCTEKESKAYDEDKKHS